MLKNKKYLSEAAAHIFFSEAVAHFFLISFRSSRTFLKKHEIFSILRSSCTHKKYVQIFFTVAAHSLHEDFHNPSMVMKIFLMDDSKTLFKNLTALYECHRPRHDAYRNKQIIHACFARMSICLDYKP